MKHLAEHCFFEPTTAHNKLRNNFQGSSVNGTFRNQQSTNRNNNYVGGNGIHKGNNIINSGAKPLGKRYNNNFQPFTNSSGPHQRSGPNGYVKTNYSFNNNRQQNPTYSTNNNLNHHNNKHKVNNQSGNLYNNSKTGNPNVKNALIALNRDNSQDGRFLRNVVQKAISAEKAAAHYVKSGDLGAMKETLKRTFDKPSSHPSKHHKMGRFNMQQNDNQAFSTESTIKIGQQPVQSCRHCGKNVIHTDGICDVYRTSTIRDSTNGQHANLVDSSQ